MSITKKDSEVQDDDVSLMALTTDEKKRKSSFQKFADRLFENADVNKDGTLDMNETYEMVLKLYVKLNRKAAIPPPSREKVQQIFQSTDHNGDNRISRQEFNALASILGRRALARLVAHRVVTLTGAPLLATLVVAKLRGRVFLCRLANWIVPDRFLPVACSASFWRTLLVVVFVASLGNCVLGCVNFILDYAADKKHPTARRLEMKAMDWKNPSEG